MFWMVFAVLVPATIWHAGASAVSHQSDRELFMQHLREHFEDIHEVSMRFHMEDPSIEGVIVFRMTW